MWKSRIVLNIMLITMLITVQFSYKVNAQDVQSNQQNSEIYYLALGDSIAKGYSCDETEIVPYPSLIQNEIEQQTDIDVTLKNAAKNGLSTARFNSGMMGKEELLTDIRKADIITITIGANDLIDQFKLASQEVLGHQERFWNLTDAMEMLNEQMKQHPLLVLKAIGVIANWDYDTFDENFCTMLDYIVGNAKDSARIIVTNIYNPTAGLGLPGTLNSVVDSIINKMNSMIAGHAGEYGYELIDLCKSDICSYVQKDGLHPTQEGQQLITDKIMEHVTVHKQAENEALNKPAKAKSSDAGRKLDLLTLTSSCGIVITGILLLFLGIYRQKKSKN